MFLSTQNYCCEDEELDEQTHIDLWNSKNVVDALGQPHCRVITEELRQQPRQQPRSSQAVNSFSMIDVGILLRFRSLAGLRSLMVIWRLTVAVIAKQATNDSNIISSTQKWSSIWPKLRETKRCLISPSNQEITCVRFYSKNSTDSRWISSSVTIYALW